jgi:hypothetical protein
VGHYRLLKTKLHKEAAPMMGGLCRNQRGVQLNSLLLIIVNEQCLDQEVLNWLQIGKWIVRLGLE